MSARRESRAPRVRRTAPLLGACALGALLGGACGEPHGAPDGGASAAPAPDGAARELTAAERQVFVRALADMQAGRYGAARRALEPLLAADPPRSDVQYVAGHAAYELGAWGEAEQRLTDAVGRDPSLWPTASALGFARYRLGDYAGARAAFSAIVAADPGAYKAHYGLGLVALTTGEAAAARAHLEHALALEPEYVKARYTLARALEQQGQLDDARRMVQDVLARSPSHEQALYLLTRVLHRLGRDDEAAAVEERRAAVYAARERLGALEQQIEQAEASPEQHVAVVRGYLEMGDVRAARAALERAAVAHPKAGLLWDALDDELAARAGAGASGDDGEP